MAEFHWKTRRVVVLHRCLLNSSGDDVPRSCSVFWERRHRPIDRRIVSLASSVESKLSNSALTTSNRSRAKWNLDSRVGPEAWLGRNADESDNVRFEVKNLNTNAMEYRVDYEPAESTTGLFGGNSNWRGPIAAADTVIIGAPMYNFSVSSSLQRWIDQIVRIGKRVGYRPIAWPRTDFRFGIECEQTGLPLEAGAERTA